MPTLQATRVDVRGLLSRCFLQNMSFQSNTAWCVSFTSSRSLLCLVIYLLSLERIIRLRRLLISSISSRMSKAILINSLLLIIRALTLQFLLTCTFPLMLVCVPVMIPLLEALESDRTFVLVCGVVWISLKLLSRLACLVFRPHIINVVFNLILRVWWRAVFLVPQFTIVL